MMKILFTILEPIFKATVICEGLTYPTISKAKILERKLLLSYERLSKSSDSMTKSLAQILFDGLNQHLVNKISQDQKTVYLVIIFITNLSLIYEP